MHMYTCCSNVAKFVLKNYSCKFKSDIEASLSFAICGPGVKRDQVNILVAKHELRQMQEVKSISALIQLFQICKKNRLQIII